jgi:hypothetical protein
MLNLCPESWRRVRESKDLLAAVDPRIYNMNLCSTAFAVVGGPRDRLPMLAHAHLHEQHFSSVFIDMKPLIVEHMISHRRGPGDQVTMLVHAHLNRRHIRTVSQTFKRTAKHL